MALGVEAASRGEEEQAVAHYLEATQLVPEAPLPYRYLGEAYQRRGDKRRAYEAYRSYLRLRPDARDGAEVRDKLSALQPRGTLEVICTPRNATMTVDGVVTPCGVSLPLAEGSYTVRLEGPGWIPRVLQVRVAAERETRVDATLVPVGKRAEPAPPPAVRPSTNRGLLSRWWFWTAVGVLATGAATGTVVAATRDSGQTPVGGTFVVP